MKKILLLLLLCAYALSTMGVGFKEFYCCGKLKSVFITLADNNKQGCTKEGCCKTKQQFLKLQDNHVASADVYLPAKHFIALQYNAPVYPLVSFAQQTTHINSSHAPPLNTSVPIYISNCVFRI